MSWNRNKDNDLVDYISRTMGGSVNFRSRSTKSVDERVVDDVLAAVRAPLMDRLENSAYARAIHRSNKRRSVVRKFLYWLSDKADDFSNFCVQLAEERFCWRAIVTTKDVRDALRETFEETAVEKYPEDLPHVTGEEWDSNLDTAPTHLDDEEKKDFH